MSDDFPYWGIDACPCGWFCVGLNGGAGFRFDVEPNIIAVHETLQKYGAKIALIDIPIGLSDSAEERCCDKKAREKIGRLYRSVFRTPCRQAMDAYKKKGIKAQKEKNGKIASVRITGGCLSQQTWAIAPKIAEVDDFMQSGENKKIKLREVHPEVCFCALNGLVSLGYSKKKKDGEKERLRILEKYLRNARNTVSKIRGGYLKSQVADDDILDALIAAVTAKIGDGKYKTLPDKPPKDSHGLPMEMVYVNSNGGRVL